MFSNKDYKQYDVIAVGNAIVDILARVDEAFLEKHGIPRAGMTLVDETKAASIYEDMGSRGATVECSGGSAANTLAALAALGANTAFIGKTKDDHMGKVFRHDIKAIGVEFQTPPAEEGPATGQCLVAVTPDGERSMATYLGVCANVYEEDVETDFVIDTSVFYVEGYLWDQPDAKKAINKAIQACTRHHVPVALTLSDTFCVERHRTELQIMAKFAIDIMFANEAEICCLYDTDSLDEAIAQLQQDVRLGLVTCGPKGCKVVTPLGVTDVPTEPVEKIIDTTGAGDMFAAGFLYGMCQGWSQSESARFANTCAGQIIQQMGARSQTPLGDLLITFQRKSA